MIERGRTVLAMDYHRALETRAVYNRLLTALFEGYEIVEAVREHHRALPVCRNGFKAGLYTWGFKPLYNLVPERLALRLAYKYSVTAIKR